MKEKPNKFTLVKYERDEKTADNCYMVFKSNPEETVKPHDLSRDNSRLQVTTWGMNQGIKGLVAHLKNSASKMEIDMTKDMITTIPSPISLKTVYRALYTPFSEPELKEFLREYTSGDKPIKKL